MCTHLILSAILHLKIYECKFLAYESCHRRVRTSRRAGQFNYVAVRFRSDLG